MSESTNRQQILTSLSRSGKKGFRTLSGAHRKVLLSLLKSKSQEGNPAQTSSDSSKKQEVAAVLASSPTRLMTSLKRLGSRAKSALALGQTAAINGLLNWRNRGYKDVEILEHPHPILSRRAEEIDFNKTSRKELVKIVRKMGAALSGVAYGHRLGIAAPQIGISKRIMVVQGVVMINPTWQPSKAPPNQAVEGCYSVPYKTYEVPRAPYGWAEWYSIDGELRKFKLRELNAIIYQHELDHLDGLCCADVGTLLEDVSTKMHKYKVLEEVTINGFTHPKDAVITLEFKIANLKSLAGKLEKVAPNTPLGVPVVPAPQTEPKVEEKPAETPNPEPQPEAPAPAAEPAPEAPTPSPKAPMPDKEPDVPPATPEEEPAPVA